MTGQVYCGDCRDTLARLPEESVHCCVTSPPYWRARNYKCPESVFGGDDECRHDWEEEPKELAAKTRQHSVGSSTLCGGKTTQFIASQPKPQGSFCQICGAWRGQFGLEPTPELYVEHTLEFLRGIRHVLRDDATCWWIIGDSYAGSGAHEAHHQNPGISQSAKKGAVSTPVADGLKSKDLALIPFRVALAAQADGWYVRSVIVWSKPNAMPDSVRDRPTAAHEYVLLLTKSGKYFYDADAIREQHQTSGKKKERGTEPSQFRANLGGGPQQSHVYNQVGKNKRTVWEIPTEPYKGPHYAAFPRNLIKPMILTTPVQVCAKCGAGWERVIELVGGQTTRHTARARKDMEAQGITHPGRVSSALKSGEIAEHHTVGFRPTCSCNAGTKPAIILDPFAGTGTVGEVCMSLEDQRDFILIDINPKYAKMPEGRIAKVTTVFGQDDWDKLKENEDA